MLFWSQVVSRCVGPNGAGKSNLLQELRGGSWLWRCPVAPRPQTHRSDRAWRSDVGLEDLAQRSAATLPLLPQLLRPDQLQSWRFAESDHCRLALICDPPHRPAHLDGTTLEASTGDSVVAPEGGLHDFENPGTDWVYLLTVVSTDDGVADTLRHGIPTPLEAEDLAVLRSL